MLLNFVIAAVASFAPLNSTRSPKPRQVAAATEQRFGPREFLALVVQSMEVVHEALAGVETADDVKEAIWNLALAPQVHFMSLASAVWMRGVGTSEGFELLESDQTVVGGLMRRVLAAVTRLAELQGGEVAPSDLPTRAQFEANFLLLAAHITSPFTPRGERKVLGALLRVSAAGAAMMMVEASTSPPPAWQQEAVVAALADACDDLEAGVALLENRARPDAAIADEGRALVTAAAERTLATGKASPVFQA